MPLLKRILKDDAGATAIEYGLIAVLVVVVWLAGMSLVASSTNNMYNAVSNAVVKSNT